MKCCSELCRAGLGVILFGIPLFNFLTTRSAKRVDPFKIFPAVFKNGKRSSRQIDSGKRGSRHGLEALKKQFQIFAFRNWNRSTRLNERSYFFGFDKRQTAVADGAFVLNRNSIYAVTGLFYKIENRVEPPGFFPLSAGGSNAGKHQMLARARHRNIKNTF